MSKKKALRARSESHQAEDRLMPPTVIVRAASEEAKSRQRPQLMRSKALLEVPATIGIGKRSLSEEVPRMRARERHVPLIGLAARRRPSTRIRGLLTTAWGPRGIPSCGNT